MGFKSGGALGGIGAAAYSGLMSTCPGMLPAVVGSGASIAMPGLMIGGPLAPIAAMLATGVVGGAMLGGATGSVISCREVGVQNETHYMLHYKPEQQQPYHMGYNFEIAKDGRYRPMHRYNHHVHPLPNSGYNHFDDYIPLASMKRPPRHPYDIQNYFYDSDDLAPSPPLSQTMDSYAPAEHQAKWNYVASGMPPRYRFRRHRYRKLQTLHDTFTHTPRPDFEPSKPIPAPNPNNHYGPHNESPILVQSSNFTRSNFIRSLKTSERNPLFETGFHPVDPPHLKRVAFRQDAREQVISHPVPMILTPTFKPHSSAEVEELWRENGDYLALMDHNERPSVEQGLSMTHYDDDDDDDNVGEDEPLSNYNPPPQFVVEPLPALTELHELNNLQRMAAVDHYYAIHPNLFHKIRPQQYRRRVMGRSFRNHYSPSKSPWWSELVGHRIRPSKRSRKRNRNIPYYGGNNRKMLLDSGFDQEEYLRHKALLTALRDTPRRFDANGMSFSPALSRSWSSPGQFVHQGKLRRLAERRHDNSLTVGHPTGIGRATFIHHSRSGDHYPKHESTSSFRSQVSSGRDLRGNVETKTRHEKVSSEQKSFRPSPRDPFRSD